VVTYVRYGQKVYSPVIETGEADCIVSFEKLEAARYLDKLKQGGVIVTNTQEIDPMPVIIGAAQYPNNILDEVKAKGVALDAFDALKLALQAGSAKAVNIVLLGRLANHLDIPIADWLAAIENVVKPQFAELNKTAFMLGVNSVETVG
jgi:indolepyruvate ferredoxin oxidoreductase beta subunit